MNQCFGEIILAALVICLLALLIYALLGNIGLLVLGICSSLWVPRIILRYC